MATPAQTEAEQRAKVLARALGDFETFCRALVWIAPKDGRRTTLHWNPIQRKYNDARTWRDVILKPRQIGITTNELSRDVWRFLQPGQRVLVMCQTDKDQTYIKKFSSDVQRVLDGLRHAGVRLDFGSESAALWTLPAQDSSLQLVESGASEAAAAKKGRGGTLTRVHSTESAFYEYPEHSLNALLESVPQLPGTEVVFESTANGCGNWFHERFVAAQSKRSGYTAHFYAWFEDPTYAVALEPGEVVEPETKREEELVEVYGISQEQLKWYRQKVASKGSQDLVDQEYPTDPHRAFLTSGKLYFSLEALDAIVPRQQPSITVGVDALRRKLGDPTGPAIIPAEDLQVFELPRIGEDYVIGTDPAEGLGEDGDDTASGVFHKKTRKHVATLRNKLDSNAHADQLLELAEHYNHALIAVERNKGLALIRALERLKYTNIYYDPDDSKPGIATTTASRPVMLEELADALRDGSFFTHDKLLLTEMRGFVRDPRTGRPYAPGKNRKGENRIGDDGIFMAAIAWRAMLVPPSAPGVTTGGERGFSAAKKSRWAF